MSFGELDCCSRTTENRSLTACCDRLPLVATYSEFEKAIEVAEEGLKSASRSLQAGDTRITYETKRVEDINAKAEGSPSPIADHRYAFYADFLFFSTPIALKQKISAGLQSIDTETTTIEAAVKEAEEEEELARK